MEVHVQTAQNVEIAYDVASVGDLIGAYLLDIVIQIAAFFIISAIVGAITAATGQNWIIVVLLLSFLFYDLLFEMYMDGQTPGKRSLKLKVVMVDGSEAGVSNYLLRWALRIVDFWFLWGLVALITVLVNGKGQRLGDLAAGTTVIKLKPKATLADTILVQSVDEEYQPTYPQAARLTDEDVALIKEAVRAVRKGANREILYTLAVKLEDTLGIPEDDLAPENFLRTLVKDHNYYAAKENAEFL